MANPTIIRRTTPIAPKILPGGIEQKRMIGIPTIVNNQITGGTGVKSTVTDTLGTERIDLGTTYNNRSQKTPDEVLPPYDPNNPGASVVTPTAKIPNTPTGGTKDKSVALMTAGKSGVTNNLAGGRTDSLPGVTKYAGIDKGYGNNQAGIDLVNKQNELDTLSEGEKAQRLAGAYNPTPTVATTQNPVIKKTLDKPQEQTITPEVLQGADMNTLNSTLDELNYKVNVEGKQLTKDEYLTYASAKRQLQDMMKPQALTGGLDGLIANKENEIKQATDESKINNEQELADFTRSQEVYKQAEIDAIEQADEESKKTLGFILGGQGAGQGTFAVEQIGKITQNSLAKKQALNEAVQAKIDLYGSQLRKDSQQTIQAMKDRLDSYYMKAAEFDVDNIKQMNEYNAKEGASKIEQIDKMMALAQSQAMAMQPLTEQEKAQAQAFAGNLYDNEGNFQNNVFEMLYKVNPKLANAAVMQGTAIQKERLSNDLAMRGLDADIKRAQLNKLLNPAKEYEYVKDADGNTIAVAKDNPNERINITGGGEGLGDLRGLASQFPGQARAKNNNPAGMKSSISDRTKQLMVDAGVQRATGSTPPPNEGGRYMQFATIEDGLLAHKVLLTSAGSDDINARLQQRVGTAEGPRYAAQLMGQAGIPNGTKFSQLSEDQLNKLLFAQIQKESPGLAKVLQSQGSGKQLSSVAKEAVRSGQINGTPTIQSGIIKELADSGEFDKGQGNSTFYTSKPAVKDEIANFAEGYAKRQQAKEIFNKLKADGTLGGATGWFDNLANKGKRFAGEGSSDVNNLNQILAESLSKYMNKISGATVSETEVERLREQIPNLGMGDKQFTDAFEQYDLSMQRGLDNTLTKYGFNSYDDVKQKIYGSNKSEQTQTTADPLGLGI